MRISDRISATLVHHTARWTVRYGEELRFAGSELPRPIRLRAPTRHGPVTAWSYEPPGWSGSSEGGGPTHVHLHGGAWLMRFPMMDDWWCRYLAATAGVRVLNVDFHTAPYAVFPRAQEEAHDVAWWAADRGPVSVGGFSSGGGMAAAVCLMARDEGSLTPRLQVLGVPALDLATDMPAGAGQISPGLRALVRRAYFPDVDSRRSAYASPLLAPSLEGLPRALVMTAERDTLRRDGDEYAARLREAGVAVWHDLTPGADHYFLTEDPARARTTMRTVAVEVAAALS